MFNGTGQGIDGGSQANGGVDDYNNGESAPSDRYVKGWTQCTSGNNYCGTGTWNASWKDDSTGLIWSGLCYGGGCSDFTLSPPSTYTWNNTGPENNNLTAPQLCPGSKEARPWKLPHQKQLMQAHLDGAYGNMGDTLWSATQTSGSAANSWYVSLATGNTNLADQSSQYYIRCIYAP